MKNRLGATDRAAIGKRIRGIRESMGKDQYEFSKLLGVSQPLISQYEKGGTEPTAVVLGILRKRFEASSDFILFGEDKLGGKIASNLGGAQAREILAGAEGELRAAADRLKALRAASGKRKHG